ncbi:MULTISPECIES: hypothetical protein [Pseudoalteromonas]|uniref:Uncharacterized protein n=1 Tax=Pseudoalteromonas obscura TaxID=3048491 RepID=A0ABT7EJR5_9GAMM|nr:MULTISPECIES: hypothetical protein [Pseudoalteromonas]MBQ4836874.1 hypothetical protein [Pseudoalteromonas luteoviolacea]MDK2595306.1 hypothetical protein [Pseudoalteromonas sp. P94(2023)]
MPYRLTQSLIDDLASLFIHRKSKTLNAHYIKQSQTQGLYQLWFRDLQSEIIPILDRNGDPATYQYTDEEIIEALNARIMNFDSKLKRLFRTTQLQRIIGFSHSEACELFARNIVAINPVTSSED